MRSIGGAAGLAALVAIGLPVVPADAAVATICTFDGTLTFTPPLSLQPAHGTTAALGTVTCVETVAGTGGAGARPLSAVAAPNGHFTGSCVGLTFTDGYGLGSISGGVAVTITWTNPYYGVQSGVATAVTGSCATGLRTLRMVTAGPAVAP